ncbi:MAG: tetratricopeptide repeat protein, partial [Bacteroidia bacterium]
MRMLTALCCIGVFAMHSVHAANLDSLRTELGKLQPDSDGVKAAVKMTTILRSEGMDEAIEFAQKAIDLADEMGQEKWKGEAWSIMGSVYHFRSNYDAALKAQMESLKHFREAREEPGMARAHVNISAVYLNRNNYDVAEKHLLQASEIANRLKLTKYLVTINTNLAIIYISRKEYDKAMAFNQASLEVLKETKDLSKLVVTYSNIGYLYGEKAELPKALEYYDKAIQAAEEAGDMPYECGFAFQNKIGILTRMGRAREALGLLDKLWPLVELSASARLRAESFRQVSDMYSSLGDYKQAFSYLQKYHMVQDSLMSEDQNARIAEMEKEQELQEKEAKMALMTEEAEMLKREQELRKGQALTQTYWIIGMSVLLALLVAVVVVVVVFALGRSRALKELRHNHLLIDAQKQEIELQNQTLRLQNDRLEDLNREKDGLVGIVAHDLKSPLNKSLGLLELIQLQGPLNDDQSRALEMIRRVTAAGNDLIRDLLDLNAVEHPDVVTLLEEVSLQSMFKDMEVAFAPEANRKSLEIHWSAQAELPSIVTDR